MLQVSGLAKSYATQTLLHDVTFTVGRGERVGLVGRNGHGKTTLLRMVLGEEEPDAGTITVPSGHRLGHLSQHLTLNGASVRDEAVASIPVNVDGWVEEHRADIVLGGLGIGDDMAAMAPGQLSGGYQMRLGLAKVLLSAPDMLLLDEPTNHLDITSVRWLEGFLRSWPGEMLLVTHDRRFMDRTCTHTLGIHHKATRKVQGPTAKLYNALLEDEEMARRTLANDAKKRAEAERFIERFRYKASKARQVQSRVKAVDRVDADRRAAGFDPERLVDDATLEFAFTPAPAPGKRLLEVRGLAFGWDPATPLMEDLDLFVGPGDRIAVIGPNGRGKTTLLSLLAGEMPVDAGEIVRSPNCRLGWFAQTNVDRLRSGMTVEQEVLDAIGSGERGRARKLAGRMLFEGDSALKKIGVLSGGERARVLLAKILAHPANVLLLDEPTHHLDMESVDALGDAIDVFPGAVVLVTHDEGLVDRFAERLVVFDGGTVTVFDGTYAEFLDKVGWQNEDARMRARSAKPAAPGAAPSAKAARRSRADASARRREVVGPLERDVSRAETAIAEVEERLGRIETAITASSTEGADATAIAEHAEEWRRVDARREHLYSELDSLTRRLEAALRDLEGGG